MISFPNAKINLGLNVVSKRADGYHNLETIFYPVNIYDALEVIRSGNMGFTSSGLNIDGDPGQNLCIKAYNLLKTDFPQLPNVQVHLHKNIAIGAGLGGGSADAAYMLTILNRKFHLQITDEKLAFYALTLGSDCPFFIYNKPCFASGRGEIFEPLSLDLSAYTLVLINPSIHISTKTAFADLNPSLPSKHIKQIIAQPIETWKAELRNDFEKPVFKAYPEVRKIKEILYEYDAVFAAMSGSGSTVYALFKPQKIELPSFPAGYTIYTS